MNKFVIVTDNYRMFFKKGFEINTFMLYAKHNKFNIDSLYLKNNNDVSCIYYDKKLLTDFIGSRDDVYLFEKDINKYGVLNFKDAREYLYNLI